ncbi:MAG TPA: carboxypeptidase regulatory-like domain-containing protein [Candidatus Acidoferrales bacterium]|nr:carboxypeptidase regulatory-like domain-containing protein [Candidatus Acidoferrales bacterium]
MPRIRSLVRVLLTILAALTWVTCTAAAQQITGNIQGTVNDPSRAVVQSAVVTVEQIETGLSRSAVTDRGGRYLLLELPVGHYRLEVAARGFRKYLQEGISLDVNETATVHVHLQVGSETQQIRVDANAALIQNTVTGLGQTVMEHEILDLPLDGRDFAQLGILQPGVVPLTPGLIQAGGGLRDNQGYAVDGQRPESNNFLIDGADNVNNVDAGFVLKPPIDAISEFRIITHNADAEFGRNTGSTTNIITRSGSNSFHGAAWEFLRNDAMDGSDYFTRTVQPLKQNQFGATFGGPIVRDKTFFFAYYEGFRNRQGETDSATVPSLPERQGNFQELCTNRPLNGQFAGGVCTDSKGNFLPRGQLFSLFTGQPIPVPNNMLTGPFDSTAQNVMPFFPQPNSGTNTFITTQTKRETNDQVGVRIDHYLSRSDSLNFRYMFSGGPTFDPLSPAGANVPGFPIGADDRAQNFVAQESHTFSASVIAVARFSYLRNKFLFGDQINHESPTQLGFQYEPSLGSAAGPPFIQVGGYASVGDPITGPRNTFQNTFDYSGSLSWVHGAHDLKFGGGYRHDGINVLQGIATNGFFVFAPFPYSDGFASFLSGVPVFFLQGVGNFSRGIRGQASNVYAQDTFKVTPRLTMNYGLRYELPSPDTEIHNRQNLFIPGAQSKVFPGAPAGLLYPGDPGVPAGLISTDRKGLAPRMGVAWDPTGSSRWLLRAAYGIFYEPYYTGQGGPLQAPISAPPYIQTPQVNGPQSFANPYLNQSLFNGPFAEPMTLLTLAPKLSLPYAQDWNLTIQKSFGDNWLAEVGYVGTNGSKLPRFIEGNPTTFVPGVDSRGNPISNENNVNQRRLYSGCTLAQPNGCVYASAGLIAGVANSSYNALEASLRKRFSHGLSFLASYTLSKSIDDVSSFNITGSASQPVAGENDLAQNPFDLSAERGRSMFDARHRFVLSYQWNLPFWNRPSGWYEHVLGNWQLNGIATLMSGTPFTVFDSSDNSLQGGAPEITGFSANRPNLIANPNSGPRTPQEWMNVNAFQQLAPDPLGRFQVFGNEGRNVVEGPAYLNWDFSAFKNIPISESREFQFRGELFNFLNHTNFRLPVSDISSPNFGQIQQDVGPRVIQVALKFLF